MPSQKILALAGSLRAESLNKRLLQAAERLAPDGMSFRAFDGLAELPLYDHDLDVEPPPSAVSALREAIRLADGLIIATPEYNRSIPGVAKNALDWASRPLLTTTLRGKVVAVCVATTGKNSGYRSLVETSRVLRDIGCHVVAIPEVVVTEAHTRLRLTDEGEVELDDLASQLLSILLRSLQRCISRGAGELAAIPLREQLELSGATGRARTIEQIRL
jgi:chromate reductase, NAD(P)H dehydrogenase (quinone)